MAPFDYPRDRKSAERALSYYSDFATNAQYTDVFQEAVYIIFGRDYLIKMDLNKRMNFFCTVCNKMMNSTQALTAHNNSAAHLKRNADTKQDSLYALPSTSATVLSSRYPADSLEFQILRSNVKVLGIHLIESYCYRKHLAPYYKCILCGAHGKREAIYKHLIGDKHTDKFIRYSVQIDTASLSSDQRNGLRTRLANRDGLEVDRVKRFSDRNLYPYKWEQEGLPKNALLDRYRHRSMSPVPISPSKSGHRSQSRSPSPSRYSARGRHIKQEPGSPCSRRSSVKRESDDELLGNVAALLSAYRSSAVKQEKKTVLETPGGVIIQRETSVPKRDQEAQVYTDWAVERCLLKLNFIVHTHQLRGSNVVSQEDAKECLSLMFSVGNLLYFTMQRLERECRDPKKRAEVELARKTVGKMQGSVHSIMAKKWNADNPGRNCLDDTKALWSGSHQ